MKVLAVIGANFGDEGKGRLVDQLVSKNDSPAIVIRFNGGAQAGHTVVCPDGRRHAFSHFGSGSFLGASTYLSEFFIGNPFLFAKESSILQDMKVNPKVFVNQLMPLSTPYDMLLNREMELWRGVNRHGSCGYGVAETVSRLCDTPYKTFLATFTANRKRFEQLVKAIRDDYIPSRLEKAGIKIPTDVFNEAWHSSEMLRLYYESCEFLVKHTDHSDINFSDYKTVVFEGAQGLGLDENHKFFPHVTRSKTGLPNVATICEKHHVSSVHVIYVIRAYSTRHGAGPFPTEDKGLFYRDLTNFENDWQGKLRFGYLDVDMITENIKKDMRSTKLTVLPSVAITCLDQVADIVRIKYKQKSTFVRKEDLPGIITESTGIKQILISRSCVRSVK
jgi:adenylosuccinate synthase